MPDTVITVGGDIRPLQDALNRIERDMKGLGSKLAKTGAGIGSSLASFAAPLAGIVSVGAVKSLIDDFDKLGENAERLGITAASMQRIGYQAKFSGVEVETVIKSLEKMNRQIQGGDAKTMSALASLGIDAAKLAGMDPEKAIVEIADAFQAAEKKGKGLSELHAILGKSYGQLLPMLRKTREELERFGSMAVVSDRAIKAAGDFNDLLDIMGIKAKAAGSDVFTGLELIKGQVSDAFDPDSMLPFEQRVTNIARLMAGTIPGMQGMVLSPETKQKFADDEADREKRDKERQKQNEADAKQAEIQSQQEAAGKILTEIEEKKAKFAFENLSLAEQHEEVLNRIAAIRAQAEGVTNPEEAATLNSRLVDLLNQQWDLKQKINAEDEANRKKLQDQAAAKSDLVSELAIAEARSRGDDKEVAKLEKQAKLEADAKKIEKDTGMSQKEAMGIAKKKADLEERAAKKAAGKIFGGVSQPTPGGLGKEFGDLKKKGKLADQFKFPGLDKFKDLQLRKGAGAKAVDDAVAVKENANAAMEKLIADVVKNTEPLKDLD